MVCGPEAPGHTLNRLGLPCIEERDCSIDICQRPLVSFCSFLPSLLQLVWNLLPLLRHLAPYMLPLRFASAPTCLLHVAPVAHTSFLVSASCAPLWGYSQKRSAALCSRRPIFMEIPLSAPPP